MTDPHPLDIHIGAKLRAARSARGLSQTALADELGLSFQQVQKYEKGANRISACCLHALSRILRVPRDYFYEAYEEDDAPAAPPVPLLSVHDYRFLQAFHAIRSDQTRKAIKELVENLADADAS